MTMDEAAAWASYRERRGPLSTTRKLEWGFALLAMQINRALGGDQEMTDFMPYHHDDDQSISLEQAMENWG